MNAYPVSRLIHDTRRRIDEGTFYERVSRSSGSFAKELKYILHL